MSLKGISGVIDYRILEALSRELTRQKRSREEIDSIYHQFLDKSHEVYQRMASGEITYDEMRSIQTQEAINLAGGNLPPYTDKPKRRFSLFK